MGAAHSVTSNELVDAMVQNDVTKMRDLLDILIEIMSPDTGRARDARKEFLGDNGVKVCNELIRHERVIVSARAVELLTLVARSQELRQGLFDELDMNALVDQMSLNPPDYQINVCIFINELCREHVKGSRTCVIEKGGSLPLLRFARSNSNVELRRAAMSAIARITEDIIVSRILIKRYVIDLLLDATLSPDYDTAMYAIAAFANMASGTDTRSDLIEATVIPRFFMWAEENVVSKKTEHCMRGVYNFFRLFEGGRQLNGMTVDDMNYIQKQTGFFYPRVIKRAKANGLNHKRMTRMPPFEMLHRVVQSTNIVVPAARCMVCLIDPIKGDTLFTCEFEETSDGRITHHRIVVAEREAPIDDSRRGDFPGIINDILTLAKSYRSRDCKDDTLYQSTNLNDVVGLTAQNFMGIPIKTRSGVSGCIITLNRRDNPDTSVPGFTIEDETAMKKHSDNIANFVQSIIEKIKSLEVPSRDAISWDESLLSQVVGFDLRTILRVVMGRIVTMLEMDRITFYIVVPERRILWACIPDDAIDDFTMPITAGMAGYCVSQNRSVLTNNVYKHPAFNRAVDKRTGYRTRGMMCVPIHNRDEEIIGVCQIINKKRGLISKIDLQKTSKFLRQFTDLIIKKLPDLRAELCEHPAANQAEMSIDLLNTIIANPSTQGTKADALCAVSLLCRHQPNHGLIFGEPRLVQTLRVVAMERDSLSKRLGVMVGAAKKDPNDENHRLVPDRNIRKEALRALANLASNSSYETSILGLDLPEVFLLAIDHPDHMIMFQGLRGLANISNYPKTHPVLCTTRIIKKLLSLVPLVKRHETIANRKATEADDGRRNRINKQELAKLELERLKKEEARNKWVDRAQQVVRCLSGLARVERNVPVLIQAGGLKKVESLLVSEDPDILPAALQLIKLMCCHPAPREMILEEFSVRNVVEKILEGRAAGNEFDRLTARSLQEIGHIFAIILEHQELQRTFREKYTFGKLEYLLVCPVAEVKLTYVESVLELLKNTNPEESLGWHQELERSGMMDKMNKILEEQDQPEIVEATARVIQEVALFDEGQRARLVNTPIAKNLAIHLKHDEESVIKQVLTALLCILKKGTRAAGVRSAYLIVTNATSIPIKHVLAMSNEDLVISACRVVYLLCQFDECRAQLSRTGLSIDLVKLIGRDGISKECEVASRATLASLVADAEELSHHEFFRPKEEADLVDGPEASRLASNNRTAPSRVYSGARPQALAH